MDLPIMSISSISKNAHREEIGEHANKHAHTQALTHTHVSER